MEGEILILDFGSQYTQLIARRVREMGVYSEIYPYNIDLKTILEIKPSGIILSGGPSSVLDKGAPLVSKDIFSLNIPILGICYGMQLITHILDGKVEKSTNREYGKSNLNIKKKSSILFKGINDKSIVWMSHGDSVIKIPFKFEISATSTGGGITAIENTTDNIFALQFHPEVIHTSQGGKILNNFVFKICNALKKWSMKNYIDDKIIEIQDCCKNKNVVLGVSGGVDSTTLAVLMNKAIHDNLKIVFVNNGLLRLNEENEVLHNLKDILGLKVTYIDASEKFLSELKGVDSPEEKRKIIGKVFIETFFLAAKDFDILVQGTLYPDVIESNPVKGPSQTIKTHHNRVKEILELEKDGRILEPFKFLFKDEVREIAGLLNIPADLIKRHPFPGPGLAVRVICDITQERLDILKRADAIFIEELKNKLLYNQIWQAFAVYLPVRSVGVMGDERAYGNVIALRAVTSLDGMTANWAKIPEDILETISNRIVREIKEVTRVVYDVTSKPPATIEWE